MSAGPARRRGARAARAGAHPAPRGTPGTAGRALEAAGRLSPFAAFVVLAWSLRGAPLGTPVADDFEFLSRSLFGGGGLLGSMGATYYWRPLSRQLWFPLVTPLLLAAPWVVAAIHVAILVAIAFVLARLARRWVGAAGAALVGAAVLATAPARVLITWPSGIQHLLAMLGIALAAHEALAGRRWSAALAALAAAVSHELGVLAFGFVAIGGFANRRGRAAWLDVALAAALAGAYAAGYRAALAHGVRLPGNGPFPSVAAAAHAFRLGTRAAFNAETLPAEWGRAAVLATEVLAAAGALVLASRRRADLRRVAPAVGVALAIGWAGLLPLASLLPDWNAWRAFVPALALVFAVTLVAAGAHPGLGLALVAVRLVALGAAEPAPTEVNGKAPPAVSDLSFARLTRMQRVVAATAEVVRREEPRRGPRLAYIGLPEMTMNGLRGGLAARVWTRDTSVTFVAIESANSGPDSTDLVVSYDTRAGRPLAFEMLPDARRDWTLGHEASDAGRLEEARERFLRALAEQSPQSPSLSANVLQNLAAIELSYGHLDAADSLNREALEVRGPTPESFALEALIALRRGDLRAARRSLGVALRISPNDTFTRQVLAELQRAEAARPPDR